MAVGNVAHHVAVVDGGVEGRARGTWYPVGVVVGTVEEVFAVSRIGMHAIVFVGAVGVYV